jgi:chromosome partitioning protein
MVIALSNSKGGVGKSTIAVHLAVWLAEQGRRVALVDSDVQSSSSIWLKEAAPQIESFQLHTAEDVAARLPEISANFDFVVADGPAGLSEVTRTILFLSDIALFPCGPSILDLRAVIEAVGILKQIQQIRGGLPNTVIVPNKLQPQYRLSKELLQTVQSFGMPAGDGLRLRQAYADAAGQGTVVWRMSTQAARDASAELQYLFQQLTSYESNSDTQNHVRRVATGQPAS